LGHAGVFPNIIERDGTNTGSFLDVEEAREATEIRNDGKGKGGVAAKCREISENSVFE
jgi:hypothetical protein